MSDPEGAATVCPRCGRENETGATNCVRCGHDLSLGFDAPSEAEPPSLFCFRHPKTATNLSCGRCERPICTRCAVIGANGVRCRECAKLKIPIRPGAVVHEVKRSVFRVLFSGPWSLWIIITVVGFVFWMIRSCAAEMRGPRERPSIDRESEPPPEP